MSEEGMEETNLSGSSDKIEREAPQLVTVLKDIKGGLDDLRAKVQVLTSKVKLGLYPTADGISYLEAKHLLLLNYCQSLVYYLLRKAKGLPIQGHPLVHSLLETRLFLEKIRPIDKKLQYQIQKLTRLTGNSMEDAVSDDKKPDATREADDSLKLRPNPDMLMNKVTPDDGDGKYRPPKIAPASMDESKSSRQERNVSRKEKQAFRQALQSEYARDLMNDLEGRPEEVREVVGTEDRDVTRYKAKMEERARREEELFTRAPLTSMEKKKLKHMRKSRNGLLGLADSFYDDIKSLPLEEGVGGQTASFMEDSNAGERKFKKHKRRH
ncbi:neuroguidin [Cynara cardunculus var. scolymus]|uniref:neuroguidin n=1 Tax=Cynara cardunculus var. scolymus TaxID=59895 RepID=UPI000D6282E3|nr:neuroguidin [Cynara cardunculus var. scolymus]